MRIEKNNYLSFEMKDHACVYCISGYHDILHKNRWIIFYIQKKKRKDIWRSNPNETILL
jgi:hypothetical protein